MRIEDIQLDIKWMLAARAVGHKILHSLDRLLAEVIAVLCPAREGLAILLHDPSAGGVAGRAPIGQTKYNLARVLLRLDPQTALICKKIVVIEYRRRPSIPRLIVFSENIDELLRSYMAFTDLPRHISAGLEVFGKDHVVSPQLRLQAVGCPLAVALDIAVPAGEIGCTGRRTNRNSAKRIRK